MTRFSAPFQIKKPFAETTVATMDASGNSTQLGTMSVTDTIKSGPSGSQGFAVLTQQASIAATTEKVQVAVLPATSDIIGASLFVKTAFATAGADVLVRVGTSANETLLGAFSIDTNIAGGMHNLIGGAFTSAGSPWVDLGETTLHVAVTAVSGAVASGASGILSIQYVKKA